MKYLTDKKITGKFVYEVLNRRDEKSGSFIVFEGRVRKDTLSKRCVKEIIYEAYEDMAEKEIDMIIKKARKKFGVREIFVKHRVGRVKVGEIAFFVLVLSAHRRERFSAIQFVINEIKKKVPIWKKEVLSDGKYRWK